MQANLKALSCNAVPNVCFVGIYIQAVSSVWNNIYLYQLKMSQSPSLSEEERSHDYYILLLPVQYGTY